MSKKNKQKTSDNPPSGSNSAPSGKKKEFEPYISADQQQPELTVTSVILGIILAVVFGAANAYLGLRVGLTVSASIPAAVISMGVLRIILRKDSILENNMVQTIGSAGESLAAGAVFTIPVLFLWEVDGLTDKPSLITISILALFGGILGILFMIPLRKALIVDEHETLPYPEGTACAEVLLAGEKGGSSAKNVFLGMGFAALLKFIVDGLKLIPGVITIPIKALKTEVSTEVYPALVGVGYICGAKISSYLFAGGVLGWLVLIPAIVTFGGDSVLYPGTESIAKIYAESGASAIWSNYIRYIGAGMVATGGIISLIKSMPMIVSTFIEIIKGLKNSGKSSAKRTEQDIDMRIVAIGLVVVLALLWLLPQVPVSLPGALMILVFGFFFGAVSSRMVGLVGSSNNPVSGMTIATLLVSTMLFKAMGTEGTTAMIASISIGSIICIIAAMAGDTSQDLKTGFLLGATPKKQQIGELIGTLVAAIAIGGVMSLLSSAWQFGSKELAAPQATLMKMIVEGVMQGNLPWNLVFIGVFLALVIEILGIAVLPVAVGLYLPLELSTAIMIGGLLRTFTDKRNKDSDSEASSGILFSSGMIAGEGIIGILLAVFTVLGISEKIDLSGVISLGIPGSLIALIAMSALLIKISRD